MSETTFASSHSLFPPPTAQGQHRNAVNQVLSTRMPLLVPLLSRHLDRPESRELLQHLARGACDFRVEGPTDAAMDQARKVRV